MSQLYIPSVSNASSLSHCVILMSVCRANICVKHCQCVFSVSIKMMSVCHDNISATHCQHVNNVSVKLVSICHYDISVKPGNLS